MAEDIQLIVVDQMSKSQKGFFATKIYFFKIKIYINRKAKTY